MALPPETWACCAPRRTDRPCRFCCTGLRMPLPVLPPDVRACCASRRASLAAAGKRGTGVRRQPAHTPAGCNRRAPETACGSAARVSLAGCGSAGWQTLRKAAFAVRPGRCASSVRPGLSGAARVFWPGGARVLSIVASLPGTVCTSRPPGCRSAKAKEHPAFLRASLSMLSCPGLCLRTSRPPGCRRPCAVRYSDSAQPRCPACTGSAGRRHFPLLPSSSTPRAARSDPWPQGGG